jgi:dolichyl-phosphate beta-glucosyltransferase
MVLQLATELIDRSVGATDAPPHHQLKAHVDLTESPLDLMKPQLELMELELTDGPLELPATHGLKVAESRSGLHGSDREPYLEIVVPAFNEEGRLGATLQRIAEYLAAQPYNGVITVVDNGSVDRTADLILEDREAHIPIRLIGCAQRGKGAAVRRGILTSRARFVGFSDADLSTPIETLDAVLPALESGNPVVIASRKCPGAEYAVAQPLIRRLASKLFKLGARSCHAGLADVHDTQCGFKFFETRAARHLFSASVASGFAFDVEVLALSFMAGYGVKEIPARWEHVEGSKIAVMGEAVRVLRELLAMRRNLLAVARTDFARSSALALRGPVQAERPARDRPGVKVDRPVADEGMTVAA